MGHINIITIWTKWNDSASFVSDTQAIPLPSYELNVFELLNKQASRQLDFRQTLYSHL